MYRNLQNTMRSTLGRKISYYYAWVFKLEAWAVLFINKLFTYFVELYLRFRSELIKLAYLQALYTILSNPSLWWQQPYTHLISSLTTYQIGILVAYRRSQGMVSIVAMIGSHLVPNTAQPISSEISGPFHILCLRILLGCLVLINFTAAPSFYQRLFFMAH